jgi:hypothetical protein
MLTYYYVLYKSFLFLVAFFALVFIRSLFLSKNSKRYKIEKFKNRLIPRVSTNRDAGHIVGLELKKIYANTKGVEVSYYDTMDVYDLWQGFKAHDARCITMLWAITGLAGFASCTFLAISFGLLAHSNGAGWGFLIFMIFFLGILTINIPKYYFRQKKKKNT